MTAAPVSSLPFHPVGGQPAFEPDALERFVSETRIATLAYVRRDGRPHQSPIWFTYRDGAFLMTTSTDAPKHRALVRDPTEGVAVRYFGKLAAAEYEKLTADTYAETGLTLVTFRPAVVRGFDNTRAIGRATLAFVRLRERLPIPRTWL